MDAQATAQPGVKGIGVVLAGGRSSRMGRDKAGLEWQGQNLLEHAVQRLQEAGCEPVLVSGRPAHPLGVPDLEPYAGPPAAVLAILEHLHAGAALDGRPLLFLPVDMPLVQAATLAALLRGCRVGEARRYAGEVFPCILPASGALLEHLRGLYAESTERGGARSMKGLLTWLKAREVPLSDATRAELRNANTPEEWEALLAEQQR